MEEEGSAGGSIHVNRADFMLTFNRSNGVVRLGDMVEKASASIEKTEHESGDDT